jgi:hypothetical protein
MVPASLTRDFVTRWSPRVGEEAAQYQMWASRFLVTAGLLAAPYAVVWGVTLGRSNDDLKVGVLLFLGLELALIVVGCVFLHRSWRAMSRYFGFKVWFFNSPAFNEKAFGRWKIRKGIGGPTTPRTMDTGSPRRDDPAIPPRR